MTETCPAVPWLTAGSWQLATLLLADPDTAWHLHCPGLESAPHAAAEAAPRHEGRPAALAHPTTLTPAPRTQVRKHSEAEVEEKFNVL